MSMPSIAIENISCQSQLNNYDLWQISLAENIDLAQLIGQPLQLSASINPNHSIETWLFAKEHNRLQLLSFADDSARSLCSDDSLSWQLTASSEPHNLVIPEKASLLIAADKLGMANAFALAKLYTREQISCQVLLASDNAFPFMVKPARFLMDLAPAEAIGACTLLEDWQVPNRLASDSGLAGCFDGNLLQLLSEYLQNFQLSGQSFADTKLLLISQQSQAQSYQNLLQKYPELDYQLIGSIKN